MKKGVLAKALSGTELPGEVILDVPYVSLSGDFSCNIENHRGIISYDDRSVKINTGEAIIKIGGEGLALSHITDEIISVSGKIKSLEFI
ncbi:MAG: YabP/YqfC family sporulation protein [Clostridia bacterium]|nr:YabP/YqfC family sporulation protein [Clostridia bacterium]